MNTNAAFQKYLDQIADLRVQLRAIPVSEEHPAGPEFYELCQRLDKVWKNFRAYCRRHNAEFPYEEAMYA